ncbi:MAG: exopolysaccharide biosynthesis polyprenyl glycosylphosphotransferase [Anaerolineales bacterium]|nr:exopolysaccharide biosynthesis polyprenyl glycosylphosphotransferase [Anaerolineales bacterium]
MARERKERRLLLRTTERRMLLIFGDFVVALAATIAALALWSQLDYLALSEEFVRVRAGWFVLLPFVWLILMVNLYDIRRASSWSGTLRGVLAAAAVGTMLYLGIYFFRSEPGSLPRRGPLYFLIIVVLLTLLWRLLYVKIFTRQTFMRRALIIGAGSSGRAILDVLESSNPSPFYIVGLIDDDPAKHGEKIHNFEVLGDSSIIDKLIDEEYISDIIVAIMGTMQGSTFQTILDAQEGGVEIIRMPVLYEELLGRVPIQHLESDWLLRSFVDEVRISRLYTIIKRILDIVGAMFGLLLMGLFFPLIAIAVLMESGRPILFTQTRLGQGGKSFELLKFRTMSQDAEADGLPHWSKVDDPRATRVGRVLRKTHMDEFPQFINVLKGDMSMVGPRPERPEFVEQLEKQIPFYRARLLTKPGIGGWAQVNYGKGGSIEGTAQKLEFDLYYIKNRSIWLDLWVILRSVGAGIGLRGV